MKLKYRVKTLAEVPEAFHSLYIEKDGEFVLEVDGAVSKDKLDEFRDTNIALKRERDELTAKYGDIDPDKYRELSDLDRRQREKKLIDAGKVDELVAERVNAMKSDFEKQLAALGGEKSKLTTQLEGLVIDNAIRDAATKAGVRSTAVDDVLLRGRSLFKLQDGRAVPMEGDKPIFGKSGDPMDIGEWVGTLTEKAPHLFESSSGGGAKGSQPQGLGAGRISRDDSSGFLANLDAIASGKATVV
jgi:hypothetical protein